MESVSSKNQEIAGEGRDNALESEGETGRDEPESGGEPGGIVKPDRDQTNKTDDCDSKRRCLTEPELGTVIAQTAAFAREEA
jgi:hypothetical protein